MNRCTARKVESSHREDPAVFVPHPSGNGEVDEERPDADEDCIGSELEAIGGCSGDQRGGDDREHHLECNERKRWD